VLFLPHTSATPWRSGLVNPSKTGYVSMPRASQPGAGTGPMAPTNAGEAVFVTVLPVRPRLRGREGTQQRPGNRAGGELILAMGQGRREQAQLLRP